MSNLTYIKKYDTIFKKTFFNMRVPLRYSYTLPGIFPAIKQIQNICLGAYHNINKKSSGPECHARPNTIP